MMTWLKIKFAAGVGVVALLAVGATTVAISQTSGSDELTALEIAQQAADAYTALSSYSDTGTVVAEFAGKSVNTTFTTRLQRPNLYRVDWTKTSVGTPQSEGSVWSAGDGDFLRMSAGGRKIGTLPEKRESMRMALGEASDASSSASVEVPAAFFDAGWGSVLRVSRSPANTLTKEPDAKVGEVDCNVFTSTLHPSKVTPLMTTTFWIGKKDHLIHQVRTTIDNSSVAIPATSDETINESIKAFVEKQKQLKKPATPEMIAAWRAAMRAAMEASSKQLQSAKDVWTQTHENIVVNQKFLPADFAR